MRVLFFLLGFFLVHTARAEPVRIPAGNIVLSGEYYPPQGQSHVLAPAILMLHGCGGLYAADGEVGSRFTHMKDLLQEMGYAVLLLDSYGKRNVRNACSGARKKKVPSAGIRANDAQHALSWLNARREIDGNRLGVLGWGQGATVTLKLMARSNPGLKAAVAFEPQCTKVRTSRDYHVIAPTLVLVGESARQSAAADACRKLAAVTRQDLFHVVGVAGPVPDVERPDRQNEHRGDAGGNHPGNGTAGAANDAAGDAYRRTFKWFSRWFDPARGITGQPPRQASSVAP